MSDYSPTQEVRFSVVMFGGVSLCIYMNGISEELLHLVRATAPETNNRTRTLLGADQLEKTETVYRKLGQILYHGRIAGEATARPADESPVRTRILIDLLSGTSAGGINAVYLAKALTNDRSLKVLHDLWLEKANIDTLMNDEASERNVYPSLDPPTSLLNSQRMFGLLLEAFDAMDGNQPRTKDFRTGLVDELDLFVTTTDLNGLATPVQLSDRVVEERVHKARFRFMYSPKRLGLPNDFTKEFNEMLAFAARCTSSFPIAFEPMTFRDVGIFRPSTPNELDKKARDTGEPHRYLKFFGAFQSFGDADLPIIQRPLADGGYLNNKPFSFVIGEQTLRRSDHPVRRKLLFLDPFPEMRDEIHRHAQNVNFVENSVAAASSLPRQQPIREDIERVNANNRKIRASQMLAEELEHDIPNTVIRHIAQKQQLQGDWQDKSLSDMVKVSGESYSVYHRIRVSVVSDDLALMVTRLTTIFNDDSDELYAIRLLIHAWRSKQYTANPQAGEKTENYFLYEFDLGYRFRRLSYVRRRIDEVLEAVRTTDTAERANRIRWTGRELGAEELKELVDLAEGAGTRGALISGLMEFRRAAEEARDRLTRLREQLWMTNDGQTTDAATEIIRRELQTILFATELKPENLRWILRPVEAAQCQARALRFYEERPKVRTGIQQAAERLSALMKVELSGASKAFLSALNPDPDKKRTGPQDPLSKLLWLVYQYFDCRDLLLFPIQRDNLGGEDSVIEMYRISPIDADGLRSDVNKLTGTALGAFGAFLEEGFRQNDILWGRLDGADRIVGALLPDEEDDELRVELRDEAFRIILREEFGKGGCDRFFELLMQSLDVPTLDERGNELSPTAFLESAKARVRANCPEVVKGLLLAIPNDAEILEAFRRFYVKPPDPPLKVNVTRIRRAVRIFGAMLDRLSGGSGLLGAFSGPMVVAGNMVTQLVDFALPGDLKYLLGRHFIRLAYLAEVLLIIVGWWRNDSAVASTGWLALGITLALDFTMLWIGRGLSRTQVGRVLLKMIPVLLVAALLALLWFRGDDVVSWAGFVRKK